MKIVKALIILVSLIMMSCETEDEKMTRYVTGNWETIYVKLELPTYQKRDTLIEYDIDFENPDDKRALNQGKSFTTHAADGTLKSWTVKNSLSKGLTTNGKWYATKDSLFYEIIQRTGTFKMSFGLEAIEDGFALTALQDRDRDGELDDTFYMETVRLPDDPKE